MYYRFLIYLVDPSIFKYFCVEYIFTPTNLYFFLLQIFVPRSNWELLQTKSLVNFAISGRTWRDVDAIRRTEEEDCRRCQDNLIWKHQRRWFLSSTFVFLKMICLTNFMLKIFKHDLFMWCLTKVSILKLKLYYVIFISPYKFHIIEKTYYFY